MSRRLILLLATLLLASCGPDSSPTDADGDGFYDDCDDGDPAVHPFAAEICDGIDQNCDGVADEGWFADGDGDGYGVGAADCTTSSDGVTTDGDCDDANPGAYPDAAEVCDGVDDNCDGDADEGLGLVWYRDADGDCYGDGSDRALACARPDGYLAVDGDCDDDTADVWPQAPELCDELDNDCNGLVDDNIAPGPFPAIQIYFDGDGDGHGTPAVTMWACWDAIPQGWVDQPLDCDDNDRSSSGDINFEDPGHSNCADGIDNNCDGLTDADAPGCQ